MREKETEFDIFCGLKVEIWEFVREKVGILRPKRDFFNFLRVLRGENEDFWEFFEGKKWKNWVKIEVFGVDLRRIWV